MFSIHDSPRAPPEHLITLEFAIFHKPMLQWIHSRRPQHLTRGDLTVKSFSRSGRRSN